MSGVKSRLIAILFGFIILAVLSSPVNATEYNSTVAVVSGSQYDSPKIACKTVDECVMIAHNNNTNSLYLYYTQSGFSTLNTSISFASWTPDNGVVRDNYPHVYDVRYITNDGFLISNVRTLYRFNLTTLAVSTVCTMSDDDFYFVGIYNDTYELALRVMTGSPDLNAYLINSSCDTTSSILLGVVGGMGGFSSPTSLNEVSGFVTWLSTIVSNTSLSFDIKLKWGGSTYTTTAFNLGAFPDTYDGIWDYSDNKVYYRNSTYIKTASTTDFSSWGSATDYYVNTFNVQRENRIHYAGFDVDAYENSTGIFFGNSFVTPAYTPAPEYVNGNVVYNPVLWWLGARAYSPKVACEPDMQHCLMLVYDNTAFFGGLVGIYSVDGFATPVSWPIPNGNTFYVFTVPSVVLTDEIVYSNLAYAQFPYDLYYNQVDSKYYLLTPADSQGVKRYTWSISAALTDIGFSAHQEVTGGANQWWYYKSFGMTGKETSAPYAIVIEHFCYGSIIGVCHDDIQYQRYDMLTGAWVDSVELEYDPSGFTCGYGGASESYDIDALGGFSADTNTYKKYDVIGSFSCGGPNEYDNLAGFPTSKIGYDYYKEGSVLVYKRAAGTGVTEGNWKTLTDDFVTFASGTLYYAWNKAQGETIPRTERVLLNSKRVFVFERNHYTNFGIFAYREGVYPIYVFGRYRDPITGEPDIPVNQSVTLRCPSGYTTTDIDPDAIVYTTCDTAMNMSIYTTGFIPTSGQVTFDKASGCTTSMTMIVNYLPQVYSPNVTVRDLITGNPIAGATVKIDGIATYTTDANGKAQLSAIAPIQSPYFTQGVSSCTINLNVAGTLRSYWLQASKAGYRTTNTYNFNFAESTPEGYIYKTEDALNVYLDRGAEVLVRVYTSDGVQVEGNLVSVTGSGANLTFVMNAGVPVQTNAATTFPATFRLVDERASYPENFTVTQGAYSASQNITIYNTTNYYTVTFTLPTTSTNQPCNTEIDCTPSYCTGNFFHDLESCTGGYCIYGTEACVLCDDTAGCFNTETSETCYFDSECYDQIVCLSSAVLQDSKCGTNNKCVLTQRQCAYGCEEGVCLPAPAEVHCDESTTQGMLLCMQSGIMSFISSTYGQIFTIFLVLFIAFIFYAIIGTAFKGVERVT